MIKVNVLGATGYIGSELVRLLYGHKEVELIRLVSESYKEASFDSIYRNFKGFQDKICTELDFDAVFSDVDLVFSCLPYGVLMENLTKERMEKVKIIDLGADYRFMNQAEYKEYYGMDHKSIELSSSFVYGLSEWNEEEIKKANYIANPGCFATNMELALLPLIKEGVLENEIIVDGKCGLSGSGRKLTLGTHFAEANESVKAYKIINHPHEFETRKAIEALGHKRIQLNFVPHILPMQRGMLITCYSRLKERLNEEQIRKIYQKYYAHKRFIQLLEQGMYVETRWVKNANMCHINFEIKEEGNQLIIVSAIDNLIKGGAGQAIQNMNLMFGYPEEMALEMVPTCL